MRSIASGKIAILSLALGLVCCAIGNIQAEAQRPVTAPTPAPLPPDAPKPPYKRITGPETLNPGNYPEHWPYPDEWDSAVGAPEVHHVRYLDSHVRLVEVAYFPGVHGQLHGHPYPSVFAVDAPVPKGYNITLDPDKPIIVGRGPAPKGMEYPICRTMLPQPPHAETNQDTWPHHFYRLEFLRVDGSDLQSHWKGWYQHGFTPWSKTSQVKPSKDALKFSREWPYPIAYDEIMAAPDSHKLLYEDDHIRLVEVLLMPGEAENVEGVPYPSVIANDTVFSGKIEDHPLDGSAKADPADMGQGPAPKGFDVPTCSTTGPEAPHAMRNTGSVPIHFYRIEFKRIDGDGIKTHWREWYPWMGVLTDAYREHPYVSNYY